MKIVAVEGPSFAGKSTAIEGLSREYPGGVAVISCYVDFIPDPNDIPPTEPNSEAGQVAAFETFMRIEADRQRAVTELAGAHTPPRLVILDRSVDTLLAHTHAVDQLYGFRSHAQVMKLLPHLPHLRPELTLYLDVDAATLRRRREQANTDPTNLRRHSPKEGPAYFLHDTEFLAQTRGYFLDRPHPMVAERIIAISGSHDPSQVAEAALTALHMHFHQ